MSNKWQIVLLGVVVAQGVCLSASEATSSPKTQRRDLSLSGGYTSGSCGNEHRKEPEIIEAFKNKQFEKELKNKLQVERKPSSDNLNKKEPKEDKKFEKESPEQLFKDKERAIRFMVADWPGHNSQVFFIDQNQIPKHTWSQHSDCP